MGASLRTGNRDSSEPGAPATGPPPFLPKTPRLRLGFGFGMVCRRNCHGPDEPRLPLEPRIAADPDRRLLVIVRLRVIAGGADSMRPAEQVEVVRPAKDGSVRLGEVA